MIKVIKTSIAMITVCVAMSLILYGCSRTSTAGSDTARMYIAVNGNKLAVTLAESSSAAALVRELEQGDITFTASDHGNFEKVGNIGRSLERSDDHITAVAGDVLLYQGDRICIFFGSNAYSYSRIGRIEGYTASELRTLLGAGRGDVQITLSLK